jgi:hypothetical protein
VDDVGQDVTDAVLGVVPGRGRAEDPGDAVRARHALQQLQDHRIELAAPERGVQDPGADPRNDPGAPSRRAGCDGLVARRSLLNRMEQRFVAIVDGREAENPAAKSSPPRCVGCHELERLGRGVELARHLARQLAKDVLLAREVLVERRPRAAGPVRDGIDAAAVVSRFAEHLEGSVQDPLLGPLPARTDVRAVGEGLPANDLRGPAVRLRVEPEGFPVVPGGASAPGLHRGTWAWLVLDRAPGSRIGRRLPSPDSNSRVELLGILRPLAALFPGSGLPLGDLRRPKPDSHVTCALDCVSAPLADCRREGAM